MQPAEARPRIPTQNSEISYISLRYDTAVWMADELMCPCEGQLGSEYSPNEGRIEVNFPLFFFFFNFIKCIFAGLLSISKPYKLFFYVSDIFDFNLVKNKEPARCGSTSLKKIKA